MNKLNTTALLPTESVVWAIDPFEKGTRPSQLLVQRLMNWARASNLELQPVYILSSPRNKSNGYLESADVPQQISVVEKYADNYLRDLSVTGARPVKVIIPEWPTRKEEIESLLHFAHEQRTRCIIVTSRGRSGLQRLLLGSFAESLLLQAQCPVFFLTHFERANEEEKHFDRVLFATDLSEHSQEAFLHFLTQAKRLHFQVSLFHSVSLPDSSLAAGYGTPVLIPEDFFPSQMKWATETGAQWVKLAQSHGIQAKFIVKNDGIGSQIAETIISTAHHEHAGVIAMGSASGSLSSLVTGSIARDVFRSGLYPVWIYGPKSLESSPRANS